MRYAWLILAAGLLAGCDDKNKNDADAESDRTPIVLRQLSDACQKIAHAPAADCDCRAGVYMAGLDSADLTLFIDYYSHWAGDIAYPEAEKQAREASAKKNKAAPADVDAAIGRANALESKLSACKGKT